MGHPGGIAPHDAAILINRLKLEYAPGLMTAVRRKCQPPTAATGGRRQLAVDGLSLSVRHGECFGLLGPNGAGKTSAINILSGLILQSSGVVRARRHPTASPQPAAGARAVNLCAGP